MIIPAILEKTLPDIVKRVNSLANYPKRIQVDFLDNTMYKNTTFCNAKGLDFLATEAKIEVHIMSDNPEKYIEPGLKKIDMYISQFEIANIDSFIVKTKKSGYRAGLSLDPKTSPEKVLPYLQKIDLVQFMTIEPGRQGNPLSQAAFEKAIAFKKAFPEVPIELDGHMTVETIKIGHAAGIEHYAVGTTLFENESPAQKYLELVKLLED